MTVAIKNTTVVIYLCNLGHKTGQNEDMSRNTPIHRLKHTVHVGILHGVTFFGHFFHDGY